MEIERLIKRLEPVGRSPCVYLYPYIARLICCALQVTYCNHNAYTLRLYLGAGPRYLNSWLLLSPSFPLPCSFLCCIRFGHFVDMIIQSKAVASNLLLDQKQKMKGNL